MTSFGGIRLLTAPGEVMTPRPTTLALVEVAAELAGEPPEAVFASGDGLDHYRRLVDVCARKLCPDGALAIQLHRRVHLADAADLERLDMAA